MKMSKGEKRSVKKVFIGILVMTLLVTMLPFEQMGRIIARAADISTDTSDLQSSEYFSDLNTVVVWIEDETAEETTIPAEQRFQETIESVASGKYADYDAVILKLGKDLDLTSYAIDSVLSGKVGIDLNGYSITNINFPAGTSLIAYDPNYGAARYSMPKDAQTLTLYVEDIIVNSGATTFNVTSAFGSNYQYIYTEEAVADLSSNETLTLTYDDSLFPGEYAVPTVPFIVDAENGMYSVSDDLLTITLYALKTKSINFYGSSFNNLKITESDTYDSRLHINYPFEVSSIDVNGEEVLTRCENVIFAKGSIPQYYERTNISERFEITEVYITSSVIGDYTDVHYQFDVSNHTDLIIYNMPNTKATFIDGRDQNEIWVRLTNNLSGKDFIKNVEITTKTDPTGDQAVYAKAGDVLMVTLEDGYTVSDIQYGGWSKDLDSNSYSYEDGYRADASHIIPYPDGRIGFVIPDFSTCLDFTVEEISELDDLSKLEFSPSVYFEDTANNVNYYTSEFDIIGVDGNYQITADKNGYFAPSIKEIEENSHERRYYIVDLTKEMDSEDLDNDGLTSDYIPSGSYGRIMYLDYNFVLDIKAPSITSVTAIGDEGEEILLNGYWCEDANEVDTPTIAWTNQSSVALTVLADQETGFALADYNFGDGWQTENTYSISGEGIYYLEVSVRDAFDVALEENGGNPRESGVWVASIGIDTTAPSVQYADANTPTMTELKSNSEYEGNLLLVESDGDGAGINSYNLFKWENESWVAADELRIETSTGSMIKPSDETVVYRIEVSDVVGNVAIYDNITLIGYEQDVEVTLGKTTGTYGEELEIPITITNISEVDLVINSFALREDATHDIFGKEIESVTELKAGESFTTTLRVPKGCDAGTYDAMIDMKYLAKNSGLGQYIEKVFSQQVSAVVEPAEGVASVVVEDYYYGETHAIIVSSTTNGVENVTYYYKLADADDSTYSQAVPTAVGNYKVKAVFAATNNYKEVVVEDTFAITRLTPSTDANSASAPTPVVIGRAHLDSGKPYEFGEGTWHVSGDSTNYAGGITFYVSESGDYEFLQAEQNADGTGEEE